MGSSAQPSHDSREDKDETRRRRSELQREMRQTENGQRCRRRKGKHTRQSARVGSAFLITGFRERVIADEGERGDEEEVAGQACLREDLEMIVVHFGEAGVARMEQKRVVALDGDLVVEVQQRPTTRTNTRQRMIEEDAPCREKGRYAVGEQLVQ